MRPMTEGLPAAYAVPHPNTSRSDHQQPGGGPAGPPRTLHVEVPNAAPAYRSPPCSRHPPAPVSAQERHYTLAARVPDPADRGGPPLCEGGSPRANGGLSAGRDDAAVPGRDTTGPRDTRGSGVTRGNDRSNGPGSSGSSGEREHAGHRSAGPYRRAPGASPPGRRKAQTATATTADRHPLPRVLAWAIISYTAWMLKPTSERFEARSVEWVRAEVPFGNSLVDEVEHVYYTANAPKKDGAARIHCRRSG